MFKRFTLAAVAAAFAFVALPDTSEAGFKRGVRAERASCGLTGLFMRNRAPRVAAAVYTAPRVRVRGERRDWLGGLFMRDRTVKNGRRHR